MTPLDIAQDYVTAVKNQRQHEHNLDLALRLINPDNQVFGLADAVETAYANLVEHTLGTDTYDWLTWWMYETDWGTKPLQFRVSDTWHDSTTLTFKQFFTLIQNV